MFENLLHQNDAVARFRHDIQSNSLPPSLLISGPALSGKLTAALELARSLSCEQNADWNCMCPHCRRHRVLAHSRTLLVGNRDMGPEIAAAAEVLRRDSGDGPRFLTVRAARKLLRRFDPVLWEGDEKKLAKAQPLMEKLAESVDRLIPPGNPGSEKKMEKLLDSLVDGCSELQKLLPATLPVAQVRRITSWAVHSASGDHKTVIFDAADRMQEGSRNAMLKFLEEPPPNTTAVLISDRKSLLLPTIVSRVRDYPLRARRNSEEAEVLRRVFREDEKRWGGLAEYFRAWRSGPTERLQEAASLFINHAHEGLLMPTDTTSEITDSSELTAFLGALSVELQERWRAELSPDHRRAAQEMAMLRETRLRAESLNLPVHLVLRGLYSSMRLR